MTDFARGDDLAAKGLADGLVAKAYAEDRQVVRRLLDQGHTANGFLNNEFGYTLEANKLLRLRVLMVGIAFVLPFLLLLTSSAGLLALAAILTIIGLLVERWLFFAEARHVVRLFHGDQNV